MKIMKKRTCNYIPFSLQFYLFLLCNKLAQEMQGLNKVINEKESNDRSIGKLLALLAINKNPCSVVFFWGKWKTASRKFVYKNACSLSRADAEVCPYDGQKSWL